MPVVFLLIYPKQFPLNILQKTNTLPQFKPKKPQPMHCLFRFVLTAITLTISIQAFSQDGTIYPLENPAEPRAILL